MVAGDDWVTYDLLWRVSVRLGGIGRTRDGMSKAFPPVRRGADGDVDVLGRARVRAAGGERLRRGGPIGGAVR